MNPPNLVKWLLQLSSRWGDADVAASFKEYAFQKYNATVVERGRTVATAQASRQALEVIAISLYQEIIGSLSMFKNIYKTAVRNFRRQPGYSLINIAGLAIGMACCMMIMVWVANERSYDRFHPNADRMYRLVTSGQISGRSFAIPTVPAPMAEALVNDFPEVLDAFRIRQSGSALFSRNDRRFYENQMIYADPAFLKNFAFDLIEGNKENALTAPHSLLLTPALAQKYFGSENALGQTLTYDNSETFTVTGIIAPPPANSHIHFEMVASFQTLIKRDPGVMSWIGWNYVTYILVDQEVNAKTLEAKLVAFNDKYIGQIVKSIGAEMGSTLQPLTAIHLHSHLDNELSANGDIRYVYALTVIAVFVLLMACINFMNLSTARSAHRAMEVGLRKTLGASRHRLQAQFLGESMFMAFISLAIAIVLSAAAMPSFGALAAQPLKISLLWSPGMVAGILGIILFAGLAAGAYPALMLSALNPVATLKGRFRQGAGSARFRAVLVVLQFAISITLIIGTFLIHSQLNHMRHMRLGFAKSQRLILPLRDDVTRGKLKLIKSEFQNIDGVMAVSGSTMVPSAPSFSAEVFAPEGAGPDDGIIMEIFSIDEDFVPTYEINITQGRNFSASHTDDANGSVLINETALKALGWTHPIGKKLYNKASKTTPKIVIGVFEDIHHRPVQHKVGASMLNFSPDKAHCMTLHVRTDAVNQTLNSIRDRFKEIAPNNPFDYYFLDDHYNGLFRKETQLGKIFALFAGLSIFIGCLGLLGLASFAAEQRTKEIGIRKVLGSSMQRIVAMLCREFIILVSLANLLAWPAAYLIMRRWLASFPYRMTIHMTPFIVAALGAMGLALLTVSYRAFKAASTNPVKALKHE